MHIYEGPTVTCSSRCGTAKKMRTLFLCVALAHVVYMEDVPVRPYLASVSDIDNTVTYNISYEGSADTMILWEERKDILYSEGDEATSSTNIGDNRTSSLSLPERHPDLLVRLHQNDRDMTGYLVVFYEMLGSRNLPGIRVSKSADVIHFPGARLALNVTALSGENIDRRDVYPTFVGVVRNSTYSKIVHIPSFGNTIPLTTNELGQVDETASYEVLPPDIEGLLVVSTSLRNESYNDPALIYTFPVKNVPIGHQDLFEDPFFGVSMPDKYSAGWCACTSNYRCIIKCDALGSNVDSIELYFENMTTAYSARRDIRHENKYMHSQFVFDDVTKGEKGRLICRASDGSRTEEESCNMIVYEHATITDNSVDRDGDEMTYRCSATGFPRPVFKLFIDEDEQIFKLVTPTVGEPIDDVYSVTYTWNTKEHTVTIIRCNVVFEFTADWKTLEL